MGAGPHAIQVDVVSRLAGDLLDHTAEGFRPYLAALADVLVALNGAVVPGLSPTAHGDHAVINDFAEGLLADLRRDHPCIPGIERLS